MKKIYWIILLIVNSIVYGQVFNHYYRDGITGQYELSNISENCFENNIKFEKIEEDNTEIIKGYYFGTSKIKFIDTIENGRVVSSVYFSKGGDKIFEKKFFYDENINIRRIYTEYKSCVNGDMVENDFSFERVNDGIKFVAYKKISIYPRVMKVFSKGILNSKYEPQFIKSTVLNFLEKMSNLSEVRENFFYGDITEYSIMSDYKLIHEEKKNSDFRVIKKYDVFSDTWLVTSYKRIDKVEEEKTKFKDHLWERKFEYILDIDACKVKKSVKSSNEEIIYYFLQDENIIKTVNGYKSVLILPTDLFENNIINYNVEIDQ